MTRRELLATISVTAVCATSPLFAGVQQSREEPRLETVTLTVSGMT